MNFLHANLKTTIIAKSRSLFQNSPSKCKIRRCSGTKEILTNGIGDIHTVRQKRKIIDLPPVKSNISYSYINGQKITVHNLEKQQVKVRPPSTGTPLTKEHPNTPKQTHHTKDSNSQTLPTEVTTLPNGLRVVTQENYSQGSGVAVFVDAGVVYEDEAHHGASHLLERMAFKATKNRSTRELVQQLEDLGGNISSSSSREAIFYSADIMRGYVPRLIELLADAIQNPQFLPEELEEVQYAIGEELNQNQDKIENFLSDILHAVAFSNYPLGISMLAPPEDIMRISSTSLKDFHKQFYVPNRMVLAVAGAQHKEIVELANKFFTTPRSKQLINRPASQYVGGEHRMESQEIASEEEPRIVDGTRKKELPKEHVVLGFEGVGVAHQDLFAVSTLFSLLGGGGSFSAGGPGKGMYSRLYRKVLNGFHFVESAMSFSSSYADTGIFGVHTTVQEGHLLDALEVTVSELLEVSNHIDEEEFQRAKNQVKSSILMSLESRSVLADDLGRQILFYGKRHTPQEIVAQIDAITIPEAQRVLRKMLRSKPSMVLYGSKVNNCPTVEQVHQYLLAEVPKE